MLKKILSPIPRPGAFFRPIDWTAFWGATIIAFLVYFFTLGPSVGLEDSGELAVAADHLGVPHPPGYPFWTLCSWIFCRLFSWVTYMGQPTPAWAVSLFSAVAGAVAAGCTAMLICRSGSDMLDSIHEGEAPAADDGETARANSLMALVGGLGGSLAFAFSPVEWSQSTIVEVYSLNALFLMAVFLLSYRWMRRPSDKILWLVAFVFGLGLTNYQVLLLAALPLAIIIALRNIRMFRDVIAVLIPFGLTAKLLQTGSMLRASAQMSADVINKHAPLTENVSTPNEALLWIGCLAVAAAPIAGIIAARRGGERARAAKTALATGFAGAACILLAALFSAKTSWTAPHEMAVAPLIEPVKYALIGALLAAACVAALGAAFAPQDRTIRHAEVWKWLAISGTLALLAVFFASGVPAADAAGYRGPQFAWGKPILTLLAGVAALFLLTLPTPRGLAFAIPVAAVQITAFILLNKGAMNGLTHPQSWWFFWPVVWNFIMLGLAAAALPHGRSIAPAVLFAELGVSFYAYMPIASDLRNPPMNWGYPRTWEGFKHAIMRGQYEAIKMPDFFSRDGFELFLKQLGFYFLDLRMQFTLVAAALALVPFALWKLTVHTAKGVFTAGGVWISAALYAATAFLIIVFSEIIDGEVPMRADKLLLLLLAALAAAGLAAILCRQAKVVWAMIRHKPLVATAAENPPRFALKFSADDVSQQWLIACGACFAMMSLFLVALANVRGDIQDGFIQKVKFISSHGIFSLWIGYGIAAGLLVVRRLLARLLPGGDQARRWLFALACLAGAMVALIPVYENYFNDRLVFAMGSAEQNGHTFGWQFGNYQLRGANAIREELAPDEEPLPNPSWPEEMEPSAVFFGGTDPGRFVPTYMIYGARVRPDVYLITQNALADDTYMSVMRDLYGDEIWIPSKEDSAESFNIYVSEVQSGKRPANADLRVENGRVQVTGALGVMEINGVLAKMMFDHERLRRAFYIEESYVIQWMYPYLSPHGLIMKINAKPGAPGAPTVRNDMDFWDWYSRRLLRDPAFRRDFPAQKSFSKLRAAISGLYIRNGSYEEAEQAFREAYVLYPASPEAAFRYVQEILMPMQKWNALEDLMDYTDRVDPNNLRTGQLRRHVEKLKRVSASIAHYRATAATRKLTAAESLAYARDLISVGQNHIAAAVLRAALAEADATGFETLYPAAVLLSNCGQRGDAALAAKRALAALRPGTPSAPQRELAAILAHGGMNAEAEACLNALLRANPKDPGSWMQMAAVKDALGKTREAQNAVYQAFLTDKDEAARILQGDENLQRIAAPLFRNR